MPKQTFIERYDALPERTSPPDSLRRLDALAHEMDDCSRRLKEAQNEFIDLLIPAMKELEKYWSRKELQKAGFYAEDANKKWINTPTKGG